MSFSSFIVLLRNMIMLCTTPHCPVFARLSDNWQLTRGLKQNKISNYWFLLKVVVVTYERWLLTRGSKYNDLSSKFLSF